MYVCGGINLCEWPQQCVWGGINLYEWPQQCMCVCGGGVNLCEWHQQCMCVGGGAMSNIKQIHLKAIQKYFIFLFVLYILSLWYTENVHVYGCSNDCTIGNML